MITIEPSILSADFARLGEQAREAEEAGADGIQVDVMDGHFVSNITFGSGVVRALRSRVKIFLDAHLMVDNPARFLEDFARSGADRIIVHQEVCSNLREVLESIQNLKVQAGVAINPGTPIERLEGVLEIADCFQIMTVNPGFAGQRFMADQLRKVALLRKEMDDHRLRTAIVVDGGIDTKTAPLATRSGATGLVAGSSIYNHTGSVAENLAALRKSIVSTIEPMGRLSSTPERC